MEGNKDSNPENLGRWCWEKDREQNTPEVDFLEKYTKSLLNLPLISASQPIPWFPACLAPQEHL